MENILNLLKDKKTLIAFLLETIENSEKEKAGLLKLRESLIRAEPNHTPANLAKCIATTMQVEANHANVLQNLAIIALIQCQSSGFDTDVFHMMNKMGRGQEALQQMFKNKLNGQ